jgi:hypothetical protein
MVVQATNIIFRNLFISMLPSRPHGYPDTDRVAWLSLGEEVSDNHFLLYLPLDMLYELIGKRSWLARARLGKIGPSWALSVVRTNLRNGHTWRRPLSRISRATVV